MNSEDPGDQPVRLGPVSKIDVVAGTITGDVSGQVAVGKSIKERPGTELTDEVRGRISEALATLKDAVVERVTDELLQSAAVERIDELEEALLSDETDLTTVAYVRRWIARRLPELRHDMEDFVANPVVASLTGA